MTANIRRVCPLGNGVNVSAAPDGRIKLEIWPEERPPQGDPEFYSLSITQTLELASKLPVAVRNALKGLVG